MRKILSFSFATLIVLAFCAFSAMAQSTVTGSIGGTVMNPNKEVVSGATITATNAGTNKADTATTDDSGRFKVPNLQPGEYNVGVAAQGFANFSQQKVIVEVGRETTLDIPLSLGQVTSVVEITAEAPVLNTSQQDFSSNVNQTQINELPTNGARWSNFALLTAGTVPDGNFGLVSFRGVSGLLNNNTVDGGDNNQAFFSEEKGRTRISYSISESAIREFQVNTSNYSAEYGRSAGGVVNAVTRAGTNAVHGEAFWFYRSSDFGAFNPFQTIGPAPPAPNVAIPVKPEDKRHQFGGNIGGPILKNKLFFFFNADQQKRNFPGVANASSPACFFAPFTTASNANDPCNKTNEMAVLNSRGITACP